MEKKKRTKIKPVKKTMPLGSKQTITKYSLQFFDLISEEKNTWYTDIKKNLIIYKKNSFLKINKSF